MRWLLLSVAAVVAAAIILVVFEWREEGFQFSLFVNTFRRLNAGWLAAAAALALATYLGRALRWQILIRPQKTSTSLWNLFSATAIGFTAIVLFGRPGEMVRPYLIAVKEKLSFSSQVAAWLLERLYDILMALVIFGLALSQMRSSAATVGPQLQWIMSVGGHVVGVLATLCLAVLVMLRMFTDVARRRIMDGLSFLPDRYVQRLEKLVAAFTEGTGSTRSNWAVAQVVLYSVAEWVLIVCCYVCVFQASPLTAGLRVTDVLIFVGFVTFGNVVQIPGIGGGMQIVAVMVLTELFGMPLEVSSGLALVFWAITFIVIVPFGLVLAFHEGLTWNRLRRLEQEASEMADVQIDEAEEG